MNTFGLFIMLVFAVLPLGAMQKKQYRSWGAVAHDIFERKRERIEEDRKKRYGVMTSQAQKVFELLALQDEDRAVKELMALFNEIYSPRRGDFKVADILNAKNPKGETPLMVAASLGSIAKCELLLRYGANCNAFNWEHNWSVLSYALSFGLQSGGTSSVVKDLSVFLIERGARIEFDAFLLAAQYFTTPAVFALLIRQHQRIPIDKNPFHVHFNADKLERLRFLIAHVQERMSWMPHYCLLDELVTSCGKREFAESKEAAQVLDTIVFEESVRKFLAKYPVVGKRFLP